MDKEMIPTHVTNWKHIRGSDFAMIETKLRPSRQEALKRAKFSHHGVGLPFWWDKIPALFLWRARHLENTKRQLS